VDELTAIAYLHPLWQLGTLVFGLVLAGIALPKVGNLNFRGRQHERLARVFLVLVLAGAVFGRLVTASYDRGVFTIPGHLFISVLIVILVTLGAIFGYQGGRKRMRTRTGMMQLHPWVLVLVLALMFAQGLLGIGAKGLRLIKF
jgi:hypothetical protein